MNDSFSTPAIDQESDEEFARAVGFILPEWSSGTECDVEDAQDDLLVQADFWSYLHRAG